MLTILQERQTDMQTARKTDKSRQTKTTRHAKIYRGLKIDRYTEAYCTDKIERVRERDSEVHRCREIDKYTVIQ